MSIVFRKKDKKVEITPFVTFFSYISVEGVKTLFKFKSKSDASNAIVSLGQHLISQGFQLETMPRDPALKFDLVKKRSARLPFPLLNAINAVELNRVAVKPTSTKKITKANSLKVLATAKNSKVKPIELKKVLSQFSKILLKPKNRIHKVSGPLEYKKFLQTYGAIQIGEIKLIDSEKEQVRVFNDLVKIPSGVMAEEGEISTAHLVPFAQQGPEAVWCFCPVEKRWPIYFHHQDEPSAIYTESKKWIRLDLKKPTYASFYDWVAKELTKALKN